MARHGITHWHQQWTPTSTSLADTPSYASRRRGCWWPSYARVWTAPRWVHRERRTLIAVRRLRSRRPGFPDGRHHEMTAWGDRGVRTPSWPDPVRTLASGQRRQETGDNIRTAAPEELHSDRCHHCIVQGSSEASGCPATETTGTNETLRHIPASKTLKYITQSNCFTVYVFYCK